MACCKGRTGHAAEMVSPSPSFGAYFLHAFCSLSFCPSCLHHVCAGIHATCRVPSAPRGLREWLLFDDWREDLKEVLRESGTGQQPFVFLFSDAQIKHAVFLEDLNNLLNTSEVPNLFAVDEQAVIFDKIRKRFEEATGITSRVHLEGAPTCLDLTTRQIGDLLRCISRTR